MIFVNSIKKESVLTLPKGQIVIAVQGVKKSSFFTKGLGFEGDTEREFQIDSIGKVDYFLYPTIEEVTELIDNALMDL